MAIDRIWQSGLEVGDLTEFSGSIGSAPTSSNTDPKTGTYKMLCNGGLQSQGFVSIPATRQIRVGFHWNPDNVPVATERDIFAVKDAGGNILCSVQETGSAGGNNLIIDVGGSNVDTEANASAGAIYMHIGVNIRIHSSAGWVVVYKNGIEIMRYEGDTGSADIIDVVFGNSGTSASGGIGNFSYDDMYIDDTTGEGIAVVPIKYFHFTIANGNGNYSQWTGSDGNQVDNYALVDDIPNNGDTDYVEAGSVDLLDSYATAGYTLTANEVCIAVIPQIIVKKVGTTEEIALGTRSTSDAVGSDQIPGTSYGVLWERQTTKPGGGVWDQTAIDDMEVLIKSRGTY